MEPNKTNKMLKLVDDAGCTVDTTHDGKGAHIETKELLKVDKNNVPKNLILNVVRILNNDPKYKGLHYNDHSSRLLYGDNIIDDKIVMDIRLDIEDRYDVSISMSEIHNCVMKVCRDNPVEPIKDYLDSLKWDTKSRLDSLLEKVFNVEVSEETRPLISKISRVFFISCVARIYDPGCQVDSTLVLVGDKGVGKSSAVKLLASDEWFSNADLDIGSKSASELLHQTGVWIWELAELHALKGKSPATIKSFLTRQKDQYRAAYARMAETKKRRTVFIATTNDYQFLIDGAERRFFPVSIKSMIDLAYIKEHRDQIWAEATHRYKKGEVWHLDVEEFDGFVMDWDKALSYYQRSYMIEDPWAMKILESLENEDKVTTNDLSDALGLLPSQRTRKTSDRICSVCRDLGYKKHKSRPYHWVSKH